MRSVLDNLLYIYNCHNGIGGDTKISYQPPDVDVIGHLCPRWEPKLYRMQVHLRLKTKVSSGLVAAAPWRMLCAVTSLIHVGRLRAYSQRLDPVGCTNSTVASTALSNAT